MSELHFNKIRITADAVCKLALGLKGNSGVLKVALTECLVDEEGAAGLAEALACKDTSLTSLDLSRNVVGCTGAKHLSDALIRNERLRILDLSSSSIADEGAARFASLFESTVLQWLSLNHNCFGSKAMAILQTGRNKSLRRHGEVGVSKNHACVLLYPPSHPGHSVMNMKDTDPKGISRNFRPGQAPGPMRRRPLPSDFGRVCRCGALS